MGSETETDNFLPEFINFSIENAVTPTDLICENFGIVRGKIAGPLDHYFWIVTENKKQTLVKNKLVSNIKPTKAKPNLAPAVVEDIKCDPPMQAPANMIPGPKLFLIPCLVRFILKELLSLCWSKNFYFGKLKNKNKFIFFCLS